jgi:hypothetical protein
VNVPVGQPPHTWSVVALPGFSTYEPASQVPKGVHESEFGPAAKVPLAQATHTVSLAGEAGAAMKVPAAQPATGLHSVDGSRSSSNVPASQVIASAPSPAQ